MNFLEAIDSMEWNYFLILASVLMGMINLIAWVVLYRIENKKKSLNESAKKLIDTFVNESQSSNSRGEARMKFNVKTEGGFIDGGILLALGGIAIVALISSQETVSKSSVVNKEEIKVQDTVYKCHPIRKKVIKYYDLVEKKTKPLPIEKDCSK